MEVLLEAAKKLKYSSLNYTSPEDISSAQLHICTDENIFLYQNSDMSKELYWDSKCEHNIHLHWASCSKDSFFDGLKMLIQHIKQTEPEVDKLYIEFIPEEFLEDMNHLGFIVASEWVDFWNKDIQALNIDVCSKAAIRALRKDEIPIASKITLNCKGCSRGFTGQSEIVLEEWMDAENSYLFAAELEGSLVGLCYVLLYGFDSEKGTVLWIRELVVDPLYQSKGIGRQLISHGILWGQKNGAKRSFLACDSENHNAIKLYESLLYARKEERGQINMELSLNRNVYSVHP